VNKNELCESAAEPIIPTDHPAAERLLQKGLNLRLKHGCSDDLIASSLQDIIEQEQLPSGRKLIVLVLNQLGAYNNALARLSPVLLKDQQMQLIYTEILLRSGQAEQAISFIEKCLNEHTLEDAHFLDQMGRMSDLSMIMMQNSDDIHQLPLYRLAVLIPLAVKFGHIQSALKLSGSEVDLQCLLIHALYREGYTVEAKRYLSRLPDPLSLGSQQLYREIAFISAEVLHDEGSYKEASRIFEALIRQAPEMARARFGAASCYLHETMDNLINRIELYHPSEEEQRKINKYLDTLKQTLSTLEGSNWHTIWSPLQQNNLAIRRLQPLN